MIVVLPDALLTLRLWPLTARPLVAPVGAGEAQREGSRLCLLDGLDAVEAVLLPGLSAAVVVPGMAKGFGPEPTAAGWLMGTGRRLGEKGRWLSSSSRGDREEGERGAA